jgi:hypothetical protein
MCAAKHSKHVSEWLGTESVNRPVAQVFAAAQTGLTGYHVHSNEVVLCCDTKQCVRVQQHFLQHTQS